MSDRRGGPLPTNSMVKLPGLSQPSTPSAASPASPPSASVDSDPSHSRVQGAMARYEKLMQVQGNIDAVRRELTSLLNLGDMVDSTDVVKSGSRLVAHGLDPKALAGVFADMPPAGEALQQWIQGHVEGMEQKEAALAPLVSAARHAMATAGMTSMLVHGGGTPGGAPGSVMPDLTGMASMGRA